MPKQKQQLDSTAFFVIVAGFLLIALAIFLVFSQNNATSQTTSTLSEEEQDALVPRISLDDAKSALDSSSAIFLDVRSAEAYQSEHITGAINIPLAEIESRISELDPNQWIITYCTWQDEHSSARVASILLANGFQKVNAILGGFAAWLNAGYPTQPKR